ncbi:uncharacterized protein B0T23DRAFT_438315 [Neurospora hispaniola]|uniref:Uncharacterized protein n=1 Tax=Neurospora hispaniola TaxID=588809 RepID=A0AAJ0MTX1_9PEZI|nr:hypothetical protein B0T23DRAFT_438315 [Neurospora hispaniola]
MTMDQAKVSIPVELHLGPYPGHGFIFKAQGTTRRIAQLSHHLTTFILRRNQQAVHPNARQSNSREPRRNGPYPSPQHLLYLYLDCPPPCPRRRNPFCTSFAFLMFIVMTMPPTKKRGAMWDKTRNGHLSNQ